MKILLLSPNQIKKYNWGHQLFRNEIGRQHDVIYYGNGYKNYNPNLKVNKIIKNLYGKGKKPDFVLTYGWRYTKPFLGLEDIKIPKVHIAVDYFEARGDWGGTLKGQNIFFSKYKPDIVFGVVSHVVNNLKSNNISNKVHLLPFSVDTDIYKKIESKKNIDVLAAFTTRDDVYPNRRKIQKLVSKMNVSSIIKRVSNQALISSINRSKIVITSNNTFNSLSMRYAEVLSCGGFLLADKPEDFNELGYQDGKHLVLYKDLKDLKNKIEYYLSNEKERENIAKNGMKLVRENHSCKIRVEEFANIIKENLLK